MILVDMNNIVISAIMAESKGKPVFNESLIRHMIFNMLRSYNVKFKSDFKDMVLCFDSKQPWRKIIFSLYKENRKKSKEKDGFDWDAFYTLFHSIQKDLEENFPYFVAKVDNCEADDLIAHLAKRAVDKTVIISSDTDFFQLQALNPHICQYSPYHKKMVSADSNATLELIEHIIKGDSSDGIPNILSDEDTLVNPDKRQKPISQKFLEEIKSEHTKAALTSKHPFTSMMNLLNSVPINMKGRVLKNKMLIDLSVLPTFIEKKMESVGITKAVHDRSKILPYFMKHDMTNLIPHISEF